MNTSNRPSSSNVATVAYSLIVATLSIYILIIGKSLLLPTIFAILFALVLSPITNLIQRYLKNGIISVLLTFLAILIPLIGIVSIFGVQFSDVISSMDSIGGRLDEGLRQVLKWLQDTLGVTIQDPSQLAKENSSNITSFLSSIARNSISSTAGFFTGIGLTIIFLFFFLLYRKGFKGFIMSQIPPSNQEKGIEILHEIKAIIQKYFSGTFFVILILAVLNSLGLWLIGLDYAIFWGCLGAFLAIVPYIGTTIGGILPMLYSLAVADTIWQPIGIFVMYQGIQALEGNIITPKVVGSNVQINPLAAIFAMFFWGMIWGIGGIILAIPITAIIKLILSQSSHLKPISILLGNKIQKKNIFENSYNESE